MSDQFPCNFKSYDMGQSSRNENCYDVPADSWLQSFPSLNNSDFQDIFEVLARSGQTDASVTSKLELPFQRDKNGRSTGTVSKLEEMVNLSYSMNFIQFFEIFSAVFIYLFSFGNRIQKYQRKN